MLPFPDYSGGVPLSPKREADALMLFKRKCDHCRAQRCVNAFASGIMAYTMSHASTEKYSIQSQLRLAPI